MEKERETEMTGTYVCVDLETTGLEPKRDRIIEIGAVKVRDGVPQEEFSTLVNPQRQLEERIVTLTGIQEEDLKDAPRIEEVLPKFLEFAEELPLLGHAVLFDFSFLKRAEVNLGYSFERKGVDTLQIARKYLPELESRSLGFLCSYYEIPHTAHRALGDARATAALYGRLGKQFYEKEWEQNLLTPGKNLFCPHPLIHQVKKEKPITIPQKEQLYKLVDRHKLVLAYEIESLSRSEASRQISKILQEYGR